MVASCATSSQVQKKDVFPHTTMSRAINLNVAEMSLKELLRDTSSTLDNDAMDIDDPTNEENEEDDPVVDSYEVYLQHSLSSSLHLLQYPQLKVNSSTGSNLSSIRYKPNHKLLEMTLSTNRNSPHYSQQHESTMRSKSTNGKRVMTSSVVPMRKNYAVGVLRSNMLYMTPLQSILRLKQKMEHMNREEEILGARQDGEKSNKDSKKRKRVTVIQPTAINKREQREREKSYEFLHDQELNEPFHLMQFYPKHAPQTADQFEKLVRMSFNDVKFDMTPSGYIDTLVPYKEDPLTSSIEQRDVFSLDRLKSLDLEGQVYQMLKAARILSFTRIKQLVTKNCDDLDLCEYLSRFAVCIGGRWIVKSVIVGTPGFYERRDYLLVQFSKSKYVNRLEFARDVCLPLRATKQLFEEFAVSDGRNVGWRLKIPEDNESMKHLSEVLEQQTETFQMMEKEVLPHLKTGFRNIKTNSHLQEPKLHRRGAVSVRQLVIDFIKNMFEYGVVSTQFVLSQYKRYRLSHPELSGISEEKVMNHFQRCAVKFNGAWIRARKPSQDPRKQKFLNIRKALCDLLEKNQMMKISDMVQELKKQDLEVDTSEFSKVMDEIAYSKNGKYYCKTGNGDYL